MAQVRNVSTAQIPVDQHPHMDHFGYGMEDLSCSERVSKNHVLLVRRYCINITINSTNIEIEENVPNIGITSQ